MFLPTEVLDKMRVVIADANQVVRTWVRTQLSQAGVNVPVLRERLGEALGTLPKVTGQAGNLSIGNDLARLLNVTDKLAQDSGDTYIASEWFLLAALDDSGAAGQELKASGADKQKLRAAIEKLRVAMVDPDQATLTGLTSPLLSYGHSGGKVDTQASFIGALMDKSSDFVSITLSDQTISISGNVAVVRHTLAGATNDRGTPGNVTIKVLTIWQKDGGQWRLLARQAVRPT